MQRTKKKINKEKHNNDKTTRHFYARQNCIVYTHDPTRKVQVGSGLKSPTTNAVTRAQHARVAVAHVCDLSSFLGSTPSSRLQPQPQLQLGVAAIGGSLPSIRLHRLFVSGRPLTPSRVAACWLVTHVSVSPSSRCFLAPRLRSRLLEPAPRPDVAEPIGINRRGLRPGYVADVAGFERRGGAADGGLGRDSLDGGAGEDGVDGGLAEVPAAGPEQAGGAVDWVDDPPARFV